MFLSLLVWECYSKQFLFFHCDDLIRHLIRNTTSSFMWTILKFSRNFNNSKLQTFLQISSFLSFCTSYSSAPAALSSIYFFICWRLAHLNLHLHHPVFISHHTPSTICTTVTSQLVVGNPTANRKANHTLMLCGTIVGDV